MFIAIDNLGKIVAASEAFFEVGSANLKIIETDSFDVAVLGRAFYENGQVKVYDPLSLTVPSVVAVNTPLTVVAILPANSPDTEVQFMVAWQDADGVWHRTDPVSVAVVNGRASKDFQFAVAGKYLIEALSEHHGLASAEVVVS